MGDTFGPDYAKAYDLVYSDKDYEAECRLLDGVFRRFSKSGVRSVLDLGCGTGSHAVELARSGYDVVGVDKSESMLTFAREKAASEGVAVEFLEGDVRALDLGRQFDAVVAMFAVLGYQVALDDLLRSLRGARRHLQSRGLLVGDVWFGPAVVHQRPEPRFRAFEVNGNTVLKASSGALDVVTQTCTVSMEFWIAHQQRIWSHAREVHTMRFFFADELKLLCSTSGFELLDLVGFPDVTSDPGIDTWNVLFVASAE